MNKKPFLVSIISLIILSVLFGYSLVFAGTGLFDNSTKLIFKLSDKVFTDSIKLNRNFVVFESGKNLENYKIKSSCDIFSTLKLHKNNKYFFEIKYFNKSCNDFKLELIDDSDIVEYTFSFDVIKDSNILGNLLDVKTVNLLFFQKSLKKKIASFSKFDKYNPKIEKNYYTFLKENRLLQEYIYNFDLVSNILSKRNSKYKIPVPGYKMPITTTKLPNSSRGYRKHYTDGIHHGFDIDTKFGEGVIAIDDGIIVRVVSDFKFSDLGKIKKTGDLNKMDKVRNLDFLRGNQIWLKTMSGDVIFYSHLNEIFTNIEEGEVVKKGQPLGTIGISGVPDKAYKDYHLHFPIQMNPFISSKIGKYDMDDYMNWDRMFKGKSVKYMVENQGKYFE